MKERRKLSPMERVISSGISLPLDLFELMEDKRWQLKLTRSEFIRLAIKLFLEDVELRSKS